MNIKVSYKQKRNRKCVNNETSIVISIIKKQSAVSLFTRCYVMVYSEYVLGSTFSITQMLEYNWMATDHTPCVICTNMSNVWMTCSYTLNFLAFFTQTQTKSMQPIKIAHPQPANKTMNTPFTFLMSNGSASFDSSSWWSFIVLQNGNITDLNGICLRWVTKWTQLDRERHYMQLRQDVWNQFH